MNKTSLNLTLGTAIAASLLTVPLANAGENPFAMQAINHGMQVAEAGKAKEGKCGEGKCGGDKIKGGKTEMQDGAMDSGKTKEGKCGANKAKEASCGANKGKEEMKPEAAPAQ